MGPKPGHEAGAKGTVARLLPQNDSHCEGDPHTHIDSTDPFGLLLGTKRPPFFPYCRVCTRALAVRTRYTQCGPDNNQSDKECSVGVHG